VWDREPDSKIKLEKVPIAVVLQVLNQEMQDLQQQLLEEKQARRSNSAFQNAAAATSDAHVPTHTDLVVSLNGSALSSASAGAGVKAVHRTNSGKDDEIAHVMVREMIGSWAHDSLANNSGGPFTSASAVGADAVCSSCLLVHR
jgi:hypothetical protein